MTKHDKIFIPCFGKDATTLIQYSTDNAEHRTPFPVKEQSNVIVLSDSELQYIQNNLLRLHLYLESGETICFDNEYALRGAKELHEFLQQNEINQRTE